MRIFLTMLILLSGNAFADWSTYYVKDEMRGTQKEMTDIVVSPVNGNGPKLRVSIAKKDDNKTNIALLLDESREKFDCEDSCELSMRFDDFGVTKQRFIKFKSTDFLTPSTPQSLIRSMNLADSIYIEIPIEGGSVYQYKISKPPLPKPIEPNPKITIFNVIIGADQSTLPSSFTPTSGGCYEAMDMPLTDGSFKVPRVGICLIKGKVATMVFEVSDKKQKKTLYGYLTKAFGSRHEVMPGMYDWPDEPYRISYNTVRAGMIGNAFVVSDGISDYFNK